MDDAKLLNGMTLDDIGQRLVAIDEKVTSLQDELRSGFKRVDQELNAAKIRDEEAHRLLTFSLEAREGLRESVEARFDEADKKHDEQIDLLKQVVQHLATQQADS
jgi:thymidylate synthase